MCYLFFKNIVVLRSPEVNSVNLLRWGLGILFPYAPHVIKCSASVKSYCLRPQSQMIQGVREVLRVWVVFGIFSVLGLKSPLLDGILYLDEGTPFGINVDSAVEYNNGSCTRLFRAE